MHFFIIAITSFINHTTWQNVDKQEKKMKNKWGKTIEMCLSFVLSQNALKGWERKMRGKTLLCFSMQL